LAKKAELLSIEDFSLWDTTAPVGTIDKKFSFEEAYALHHSVVRVFDLEFADFSDRMIAE